MLVTRPFNQLESEISQWITVSIPLKPACIAAMDSLPLKVRRVSIVLAIAIRQPPTVTCLESLVLAKFAEQYEWSSLAYYPKERVSTAP